jgi:hypothetical protein
MLIIVKKNVYMNICLSLIGYRDRVLLMSGYNNSTRFFFFFLRLDEERNLQKKGGRTSRTARSHLDPACRMKKREDNL